MPAQKLRWEAPEHKHTERGADWYWALGVIAVSSALTAILFQNFLFALLIAIAAFTLGMFAMREPRLVIFELDENGFHIDDLTFRYPEMYAFWVREHEDGAILLLDTPRFMNPDIIIPIEGIDPAEVRAFLRARRVPEVELTEPWTFTLFEALGF